MKGKSVVDVALGNLLCAEGLPGAHGLDVPSCLTQLDRMAKRVEEETDRHWHHFRKQPEEFNQSEGYFRLLLMAVVLQEDFSIRYNPERIRTVGDFEANDQFFADARDVFLNGLLAGERRMGTCASLPVLYVAVGRRLGYPLKLVPSKNHLFVRWEDSRERFNVDATAQGMNLHDDNHYRRWPFPISREEEQTFGYLKSLTPAEELTTFLALRGHCLLAAGRVPEAIAAHEAALRFSPDSRLQQLILSQVRSDVQAREQKSKLALLPPELREPGWTQPQPRPDDSIPNPIGLSPSRSPNPINPLNAIRGQ
jgi:Transglutaminase-like superfamily